MADDDLVKQHEIVDVVRKKDLEDLVKRPELSEFISLDDFKFYTSVVEKEKIYGEKLVDYVQNRSKMIFSGFFTVLLGYWGFGVMQSGQDGSEILSLIYLGIAGYCGIGAWKSYGIMKEAGPLAEQMKSDIDQQKSLQQYKKLIGR